MEDTFKKESEEYLKYLDKSIQQGLGLTTSCKNRTISTPVGTPMLYRIIPLLIYKEKLMKALAAYRKRLYPENYKEKD